MADLEDAELLLWALQCIVDFADAVASLVDDEFGTSDTTLVVPRWVRRTFWRNVTTKVSVPKYFASFAERNSPDLTGNDGGYADGGGGKRRRL